MTFDAHQRACFARLADELIPAADGMLAASAAGASGEWLDAVLTARPDLMATLTALLHKAAGQPPAEFLAQLRAADPLAFGALAEVAAAAYFMNPDVRQRIGYAGQGPQPIDPAPDYLDLLEPVLRRGPIYRPTPAARDRGSTGPQ
jgi:hypothetical protein